MSTKLRTAIQNRKKSQLTEMEDMKEVLKGLAEETSRSSYAVILNDVFERGFEQLKKDITPMFEEWITTNFDEMIEVKLRGETGEQGIKGVKGNQGEIGKTGKQGIQGIQGVSGIGGKEGPKGIAGPKGDKGIEGGTGDKGDSVTLQEVLDEVGPELAAFKVEVKNTMRQGKKSGGGQGGGGMGNIVSFTFTGDGSTTEFALPHRVAASGLALWAYVNGQWIQPGVHFNVSDKTLTMTSVLDSVDVLEGFLIRT